MSKTVMFPHQRFENKIKRLGGRKPCWIWTGATYPDGRGKLILGSRRDGSRRVVTAAVFSHRFYNGVVPEGHVVILTCGNRRCVRPEHLRTGTRSDMVKAAVARGSWIQSKTAANNLPKDVAGERNPNAKLTKERVVIIRNLDAAGTLRKNIARQEGISEANVSAIVRRKSWNEKPKQNSSIGR